mmetsp:Transcript_15223/g.27093  ORF Transcript_15223/g.27093 Transcript_15223/m.27093 type:complete len:221 (+) Transcript_15223:232-894(+)
MIGTRRTRKKTEIRMAKRTEKGIETRIEEKTKTTREKVIEIRIETKTGTRIGKENGRQIVTRIGIGIEGIERRRRRRRRIETGPRTGIVSRMLRRPRTGIGRRVGSGEKRIAIALARNARLDLAAELRSAAKSTAPFPGARAVTAVMPDGRSVPEEALMCRRPWQCPRRCLCCPPVPWTLLWRRPRPPQRQRRLLGLVEARRIQPWVRRLRLRKFRALSC